MRTCMYRRGKDYVTGERQRGGPASRKFYWSLMLLRMNELRRERLTELRPETFSELRRDMAIELRRESEPSAPREGPAYMSGQNRCSR